MVHLGRDDLAALGAERSIQAAYEGDDELQWATVNGLVLTAVAPAAGERGDHVRDYITLSGAAATRLDRDLLLYNVNFGPVQVAMQACHAHSVLKEPGRALDAAHGVRRSALRPISWGAHLLDVAQAETDARRPRAATETLQRAHDTSPVWFRHQGLARSLVREVREIESRPSSGLRSLVNSLGIER